MSNSIRITADLFNSASEAGMVMTRSAAQQVEHWARLGQALESKGLPLDSAMQLLAAQTVGVREPAALWQDKRQQQALDRKTAQAGAAAGRPMSLFSTTRARRAKVLNGPY